MKTSIFFICLFTVFFNPSFSTASQIGGVTGDLDDMLSKEEIRILLPYSKTYYFVDEGQQRGLTYEQGVELGKYINQLYPEYKNTLKVTFIPTKRNDLIYHLLQGKGDIIAADLTITESRQKAVNFTPPLMTDVAEVLVQFNQAPEITDINELSGQTVHLRQSSSYYENLQTINKQLKDANLKPVEIAVVDEFFEDEDILEMVNAGVYQYTFIDSHKVDIWLKIFDQLKSNPSVAINTGGQLAWAFRPNSPELEELLRNFVKNNTKGTLMGNILINKYLKSTKYIEKSHYKNNDEEFLKTLDFIKLYAEKYDFDWLMIAAVGFQESKLDQSMVSPVGAIGVMQLMSSTAKDRNVDIDDIHELENNIHAGVKYLNFLHDRYFTDPQISQMDQWLLTFASYNAGPARVRSLRKLTTEMGLDPNVWFGNVEMAAAKVIGRETVQYVSNIYKYYIAYSKSLEYMTHKSKTLSKQ